ncbi:hypothetical protein V8E36_005907, partial [Tilletia maclaganii]
MSWRRRWGSRSHYHDDSDGDAGPAKEEDSGSEGSDTPVGEEEGSLFDLGQALAAAPMQRDDFSFGGVADFLPSAPGLVLDGIGPVALPVVDADRAEAIARKQKQIEDAKRQPIYLPPLHAASNGRPELRHQILKLITAKPEAYKLVSYYLELYPTADELVPNLYGQTEYAAGADLVALMRIPALWDQASVRNKVVPLFKGDERRILAILSECIKASSANVGTAAPLSSSSHAALPADAWNDFAAMLMQCQRSGLTDPELEGPAASTFRRQLWQIAFILPDEGQLCGLVVKRFGLVKPELLKECMDVLYECATQATPTSPSAAQFAARRELIAPLLKARAKWNEAEQQQLEQESQRAFGWSFPRAICPDKPEIVAWLRGPERQTTTYGFNGIAHARNSANRRNQIPQVNCSYMAEADGIGQRACVILTKTDKHFGQCLGEKKALGTELGRIAFMLGADGQDKENARPAKRTRV